MGRFHAGEAQVQERLGVQARLAEVAHRAIRDHMPEQHREFYALLPFLLVGSVDASGQPWAGVLANPPGFVHAPDATHLTVRALPLPGSPWTLTQGQAIGILGLQPHTRRRNRLNGRIVALDSAGFTLAADQSFGNCPKYIVAREAVYAPREQLPTVTQGHRLNGADAALITAVDTCFIASAHPRALEAGKPEEGVDVSHRGGPAGFVAVEGDDALWIPDYAGNLFFNTLGNLALNPRAGLLFIDFERGDLLHVAGRGEVLWDPSLAARRPGAQRMLRVQVTATVRLAGALPLAWHARPAAP